MEFKQEVLDVLAEVCQEDAVKENPDIEIFEEGLLDSFGTVELLVAIETASALQCRSLNLTVTSGIRQTTL